MSKTLHRILSCTVLATFVAGCTPNQQTNSTQTVAPQATAPALPPPEAQAPPVQVKSPQQQRVRILIEQVEKAYANGQTAYRRGNLPEAKAEFDRAVDLMLTSGIDIKADPELQDEFDHILDSVNGLEMEALKQGNGFEPKVEPAPADVAEEATFAVDPNLIAKAQSELATTKSDLPLVVNDYVGAFINFFANTQKGHNTLLHSFQRSGRYKAMIQRVMAEEGVPQDLIYLAVAESGFQPRAINAKSRAGGMWQFMPTGYYGLVRNSYVDERFDPEKSTRAYARYMKFLYDQLGDWYLAMAAYDWGAGNVQRAVEKTGYADFWELYKRNNLPGETKNYVPEILAAIIIANHPTQYGFDEITLDPPVITDTVTINYSVDLRLVSDLIDTPVDELQALNPSLLRMTTPTDTAFDLHLPAGTALVYQRRIEQVPEAKRDTWRYHTVQSGETLASIARTFHVSESELAEANHLDENGSVDGVEALVIPVAPLAAPSTRSTYYTARRGDTLVSIADRFGVSLSDLRKWNNVAGVRVAPGRRLHISEPTRVQRVSESRRQGARSEEENDPGPENKASRGSRKPKQEADGGRSAGTPHRNSRSLKGRDGKREAQRAEAHPRAAASRPAGESSPKPVSKSARHKKPGHQARASK